MRALLFAVMIVAILVMAPFLLVWALNVLFSLDIPYTWRTWLASLILGATVSYTRSSS